MWPFSNKSSLTKEIAEIMDVLDNALNMIKSNCANLRISNEEILKFCLSYNFSCAPTHYKNLFIDFDSNIDERYSFLKEIIKQGILKNKVEIAKGMEKEKQSAQEYVYLVIIKMCENYLGSGEFHVYRGVLSPSGHTLALIHFMLLNESENRRFLTMQQKEEISQHVKELIKAAG